MMIRRLLRTLLVLSLIAPSAAPVPLALAQSGTAAPPADPPYPDGAIIESIPPDAIVLSLDETIKLALENNFNIIVQRYQPRTTATFVDIEKSAFDPLLTGNAYRSSDEQARVSAFIGPYQSSDKLNSYSASWLDPLSIGGSYQIRLDAVDTDTLTSNVFGTTASTGYNTSWGLTYTLPLLRNLGRDVNLWPVVVAQKSLGVNESVFRQTVIDAVASAERVYWDLNFAIMQLRTERFSLKLAQDFLEQNRIKVRVGTLAPIEITQAEAGVADRMESVIIFEAALRAAEDQIRRVIGVRSDSRDWDRPVRPSDPLRLAEVDVDEDEAMQAALANRPDLEQTRLEIEARDTEARARKNLRRWGLDFQGTYGNLGFDTDGYGGSYDDLRDHNQTSWSAGLALSVPIHNRYAIANVTRTENELAQAQYQLQLVEQTARVEISSAVRAVHTTLRRVQTGQVNVRLQREKLSAEQKKFENGMSTSFQVLQYQDDLANAETRENLAKADYNKAQVDLSRVKGTILAELGILLAPAAGTESAARAQSAALRTLWSKPSDAWSDPGLRLAERTADTVRLPSDFDFASGPAAARGAVTADWIGAAAGGR
jgi:outer membrane protein TolC